MRRVAKQRAGKRLSPRYIDSRTPLEWRCSLGHQWRAMPTNVTKGSWCPKCVHKQRLTIGEMQPLAAHRARPPRAHLSLGTQQRGLQGKKLPARQVNR